MPVTLIARDRKELVALLRMRRVGLGLSQLALDEIAGMHLGYTGKLERPDGRTKSGKKWGRHVIMPMFDLWLASLGAGLVVVPLRPQMTDRRDARQLLLPFPAPVLPEKSGCRRHKKRVTQRVTGVNRKVTSKGTSPKKCHKRPRDCVKSATRVRGTDREMPRGDVSDERQVTRT